MNVPSRRELAQAGLENINANRGVDDETMLDLGYDTLKTLPDTIKLVRSLGKEAAGPIVHVSQIGAGTSAEGQEPGQPRLEAVAPQHKPKPRTNQKTNSGKHPKPTTAYQRMVADRRTIPESQKVPDRDEGRRLTAIDGGKAPDR